MDSSFIFRVCLLYSSKRFDRSENGEMKSFRLRKFFLQKGSDSYQLQVLVVSPEALSYITPMPIAPPRTASQVVTGRARTL